MSQYQPIRHAPHRTWIEFEATEVIELKQIVLDKDTAADSLRSIL